MMTTFATCMAGVVSVRLWLVGGAVAAGGVLRHPPAPAHPAGPAVGRAHHRRARQVVGRAGTQEPPEARESLVSAWLSVGLRLAGGLWCGCCQGVGGEHAGACRSGVRGTRGWKPLLRGLRAAQGLQDHPHRRHGEEGALHHHQTRRQGEGGGSEGGVCVWVCLSIR